MTLYRVADRFGHDQADLRPIRRIWVRAATGMYDDVGLSRPHPLTDCGAKLSGPRHPVLRRKHRARSRIESGRKRAATLAPPI
jgi:hypothetical protein